MIHLLRYGALSLCSLALVACGDAPSSDSNGSSTSSPATSKGDASRGVEGSATAAALKPQMLMKRIKAAEDRAVRFLRSHQDSETGAVGVMKPVTEETRHPGVTAMAVLGYLGSHRKYSSDDGPMVRNALEWIASLQKDDGAIYERDSVNYVTSLAVLALEASGEERFQGHIERARDFLVRLQSDEDQGYRKEDKFYGGVGYGGDERPDLSNTQFALEAVSAAGLPKDHPFFKAALTYLERCQNLSEVNDQVWKDKDGKEVRPGNDGGAIYLPGESKAGVAEMPDGSRVFMSYGSMSYALLKSYLFCGLDRRDRRVKAVADWTRKNFVLDRHPGFRAGSQGNEQYQGLFYYYMSLARCMGVMRESSFTDEAGVKRVWAAELAEKLLSMQDPDDGSFVNARNERWQEGFKVIATGYALLALQECRRDLERQAK
jgi:Squalene-hopene cyclase C-terminal domain/Prenyltransferase and squalene oxidase repeat